jgi:hypothetical protein
MDGGQPNTSSSAGGSVTSSSSSSSGDSSGTSSGSSGSGSSGTSGGSTGSTSGTSSSTGGTTSSSTGSSTGGFPAPCVWVGDVCTQGTCTNAASGAPCVLDGGGLGGCYGGNCLLVNLGNDPNNCGLYGLVCQSGQCDGGQCAPWSSDGGCPAGTWVQANDCIVTDCALARDDAYCFGQTYYGFCCDGGCLDPTDPNNCGGCGTICQAGSVCQWPGNCVPLTDCALDQIGFANVCLLPSGDAGQCCGGDCVDLTSDNQHCSTCSNACPDGGVCTRYGCVAGGGLVSCASDADCPAGYSCDGFYPPFDSSCTLSTCDLASDREGCFNPDSGFHGICCGGNCIMPSTDPENCEGCGIVCPAGSGCIASTTWPYIIGAGCLTITSCTVTGDGCVLDGGTGVCCSGQCVELTSDRGNCGQCGFACPIDSTCLQTSCVDDLGNAASCVSDLECADGGLCAGGGCVASSCDDGGGSACALDDAGTLGACCGSGCSDALVGINGAYGGCSACGSVCPSGLSCRGGICFAPDGGILGENRSSSCAVPCPDGYDCSPCPPGYFCSPGYGFSACLPPSCGPGTEGLPCAYGPGVPGTCCGGACVDMSTDPSNCKACGSACSSGYCVTSCFDYPPAQHCPLTCGPGTICAGEACVGSACWFTPYSGTTDQAYCLAKDGGIGACCGASCADLTSDPQHCGACGVVCTAGTACHNGLCNGDSSCGPGHVGSYCNLDAGLTSLCCPGSGCVDTSSDANNCGACGTACAAGQVCDAGSCN